MIELSFWPKQTFLAIFKHLKQVKNYFMPKMASKGFLRSKFDRVITILAATTSLMTKLLVEVFQTRFSYLGSHLSDLDDSKTCRIVRISTFHLSILFLSYILHLYMNFKRILEKWYSSGKQSIILDFWKIFCSKWSKWLNYLSYPNKLFWQFLNAWNR